MSRKIFISYKYSDEDVQPLRSVGLFETTTARHYVNQLTTHLDANDHIYKGEDDNESLEGFKDETIASKLQDKIFDSSITIVLISKNMKDPLKSEDNQWIPWEVSYSLKEITRGDRTSATNAMLAVVIPDKNSSYEYFVKSICSNGCTTWQKDSLFKILGKNMFNRKSPNTFVCPHHSDGREVHTGYDHSYIHPVKWDNFISNMNWYLNLATGINENMDDYDIVKVP